MPTKKTVTSKKNKGKKEPARSATGVAGGDNKEIIVEVVLGERS